MKIIDTHSHLYLSDFDSDRTSLIDIAKKNGIRALLLPNVDCTTIGNLHDLCEKEPDFAYPMIGLHPTSVDESFSLQLKSLEKQLKKSTYCGIGEIGLDLYWDTSRLKEQKKAFEEQLQWAKDLRLPAVIHTRNAFTEVFESIYKVGRKGLRGVFHCFAGSENDLNEIKRLNTFKIGVSGIVTYKNSNLPDLLKQTPLDMILLETDAPYLAPVPYRGKRNEPIYIWETAKKIASIYKLDLQFVTKQLYQNSVEIFNLPKETAV